MIIGHQKQWQFLKKSVELGKISHAYLFSGQEKLGKKRIALEFVKLINGRNFDLGHPDLILIKPEKGASILEHARKKTTQKVNLYEKVQVPEYEEGILKIKRFLEDEENLGKSAQKILKTKKSRIEAAA